MSDQGASNSWATGSTGARLRRALEANDQLAMEHAKCVLETHRLNAELGSALSALAKASAEVERLRLRTTTPPETTLEQP